jgi:hypothetical protein
VSTIIGLLTEIPSAGGVQRAERHVDAFAAKFVCDRGIACRFLSLNEPQGRHTVRVGPNEFLFSERVRIPPQIGVVALRAAGRQ